MRLFLLAAVLACFAGCGGETEISEPETYVAPTEEAATGTDGNGGVSAPPMVE